RSFKLVPSVPSPPLTRNTTTTSEPLQHTSDTNPIVASGPRHHRTPESTPDRITSSAEAETSTPARKGSILGALGLGRKKRDTDRLQDSGEDVAVGGTKLEEPVATTPAVKHDENVVVPENTHAATDAKTGPKSNPDEIVAEPAQIPPSESVVPASPVPAKRRSVWNSLNIFGGTKDAHHTKPATEEHKVENTAAAAAAVEEHAKSTDEQSKPTDEQSKSKPEEDTNPTAKPTEPPADAQSPTSQHSLIPAETATEKDLARGVAERAKVAASETKKKGSGSGTWNPLKGKFGGGDKKGVKAETTVAGELPEGETTTKDPEVAIPGAADPTATTTTPSTTSPTLNPTPATADKPANNPLLHEHGAYKDPAVTEPIRRQEKLQGLVDTVVGKVQSAVGARRHGAERQTIGKERLAEAKRIAETGEVSAAVVRDVRVTGVMGDQTRKGELGIKAGNKQEKIEEVKQEDAEHEKLEKEVVPEAEGGTTKDADKDLVYKKQKVEIPNAENDELWVKTEIPENNGKAQG
ncbi:hypothetical protein BC936DRAFT_139848, partial [Jimgerdemannia flammicorona]